MVVDVVVVTVTDVVGTSEVDVDKFELLREVIVVLVPVEEERDAVEVDPVSC